MTITVRDGTARGWFAVERTAVAAIKAVPAIADGPRKNLAIVRSTYMALVDFANAGMGKGTKCSQAELVEEAGAQRTSIQTAIKYLQLAGVLEVNETFDLRGQAENEYVIVDPPPPASAAIPGNPPPSHEHPGARHTSTLVPVTRAPWCSPHEQQTQEEEEEVERDAPAPESSLEDNSPVAVICGRIAELRATLDPDAASLAHTPGWRREAEQLLADRRGQLAEVLAVLAWLPSDPFWLANGLTPGGVRKHFVSMLANRQASIAAAASPSETEGARRLRAQEQRSAELAAVSGACCGGDSPPCEAEADWARTAAALRASIGDDQFEIWFATAHAHRGGDDELLVAVPLHSHDQVAGRFDRALQHAAGRPVEIVICQEAITA